MDYAFMKLKE